MREATRFAVIGVGRYGAQIAQKLAKRGAEVIAIDSTEQKIDQIKEDVAMAVTLDSTDRKSLEQQDIQDVDAAVVAIGENFEAVILTSLNLIEMGVPRVIARAGNKRQKDILEKIGITEILAPEEEVATILTERLVNPNILSILQLPDDYEIAEIRAPKNTIGRTIDEIGLQEKYQLNLVTVKEFIKEEEDGGAVLRSHINGLPALDTIIKDNHHFVVFGKISAIQRFIEIN